MDQILSSLHARLTRLENLSCVHLGVLFDIPSYVIQERQQWQLLGEDNNIINFEHNDRAMLITVQNFLFHNEYFVQQNIDNFRQIDNNDFYDLEVSIKHYIQPDMFEFKHAINSVKLVYFSRHKNLDIERIVCFYKIDGFRRAWDISKTQHNVYKITLSNWLVGDLGVLKGQFTFPPTFYLMWTPTTHRIPPKGG